MGIFWFFQKKNQEIYKRTCKKKSKNFFFDFQKFFIKHEIDSEIINFFGFQKKIFGLKKNLLGSKKLKEVKNNFFQIEKFFKNLVLFLNLS